MSVTFGALGTGSQASTDAVAALQNDKQASPTTVPVAAHLTCAGRTEDEVNETLDQFEADGVRHIVALRGDAVPESTIEQGTSGNSKAAPVLRYANELVELVARRGIFDISVGAYPEVHPEALDAQADMLALKRKLDAGASRALTQFFFEPEVFLRWRDKAVRFGIDKPLVPGILPIQNIDKVVDFASRCGASVPASLIQHFQQASDAQSRRQLAIEQALTLCQDLRKEGVEDFHFYTLNKADLTYPIAVELLKKNAHRRAA